MTLVEKAATLGGNAKVLMWPLVCPDGATTSVTTGLSVLAWPGDLFRYYGAVLSELGVATAGVTARFLVTRDGRSISFAHPPDPAGAAAADACGGWRGEWAADQRRWDAAVAAAAVVATWCRLPPLRRLATAVGTGLELLALKFPRLRCLRGWLPAVAAEGSAARSLYAYTAWNPVNLVTARWWACAVFGVSPAFWAVVVRGVYSSAFLAAAAVDSAPATVVPLLDAIISVGAAAAAAPRELRSWAAGSSSAAVFTAMAEAIKRPAAPARAGRVLVGWEVRRVVFARGGGVSVVAVAEGGGGGEERIDADAVVFACPAPAVAAAVVDNTAGREVRGWGFEAVVAGVRYESQRCSAFTRGVAHSRRSPSIPAPLASAFAAGRYSNLVAVSPTPIPRRAGVRGVGVGGSAVTNVFSLGGWVPSALAAARAHPTAASGQARRGDGSDYLDLYVSYNDPNAPALGDWGGDDGGGGGGGGVVGVVDNTWGHPQLTHAAVVRSSALSLLQGRGGAWYCGAFTTPGNGHDLSLLSGALAARAVARAATRGLVPPAAVAEAEAAAFVTPRAADPAACAADIAALARLLGL